MLAAWFLGGTDARLSLSPVDLIIIVLYFALVLGLGFYLRRFTHTAKNSSWPGAK